jgi:hypothetical protein
VVLIKREPSFTLALTVSVLKLQHLAAKLASLPLIVGYLQICKLAHLAKVKYAFSESHLFMVNSLLMRLQIE